MGPLPESPFGGTSGSFNGDAFLFASEDGTFSGCRPALGANAETLALGTVDNVYKGLTDATIGGNLYAYLAELPYRRDRHIQRIPPRRISSADSPTSTYPKALRPSM